MVNEDAAARIPQIAGATGNHLAAKGVESAHLLVTAHFVRTGRVGGAEHMLYNLLNGLADRTGRLSVLCSDREHLDRSFVDTLERTASATVLQTGGAGPRFLAEQRACLDRRVSGDAILFPNYFVPPVVPHRAGKISVVLHDMQYRHFPQYFSARKRAWLRCSQFLASQRADTMIVISEFVRKDAIRWLGRSAERKLKVIPNPISWSRFGPPTHRRPIERPYILSVAAQYPHKNLEVLVRAFADLCRRDHDTLLVLCGQGYDGLTGVSNRRAGLADLIAELDIGSRVLGTGYIDDIALGQWYRHATAFAFPSVFEGFGMPVVEALGFGLPTILTKCTALPETSRGLGVSVNDPSNVAEWSSWLAAVVRDPQGLRISPSDAAKVRGHYDPHRIAGLYLDACLG